LSCCDFVKVTLVDIFILACVVNVLIFNAAK